MGTRSETLSVINGIVKKLASEYRPERIILFGSHAYGSPTADSDIDILIIKDTPERFIDRWSTVRRILSDPKRKVPLETLVLTPREFAERMQCGDQFIQQIARDGKVLYGAQ